MEIQIEKNVPMTRLRKPRGEMRKAFDKMEVGDSIVVADEPSIRSNVYATARNASIKVSVAREGADKLRIWRIE